MSHVCACSGMLIAQTAALPGTKEDLDSTWITLLLIYGILAFLNMPTTDTLTVMWNAFVSPTFEKPP